jgi:hypothetical protein
MPKPGGIIGGGTGGGVVGLMVGDEVGGIGLAVGMLIVGGNGIVKGWSAGEPPSGAASLIVGIKGLALTGVLLLN